MPIKWIYLARQCVTSLSFDAMCTQITNLTWKTKRQQFVAILCDNLIFSLLSIISIDNIQKSLVLLSKGIGFTHLEINQIMSVFVLCISVCCIISKKTQAIGPHWRQQATAYKRIVMRYNQQTRHLFIKTSKPCGYSFSLYSCVTNNKTNILFDVRETICVISEIRKKYKLYSFTLSSME